MTADRRGGDRRRTRGTLANRDVTDTLVGRALERRRTGSVRFAPYFKVQIWRDDVGGAWVDIQESYPTVDAARSAIGARVAVVPAGYTPRPRFRIMRVAMDGREPVTEVTA